MTVTAKYYLDPDIFGNLGTTDERGYYAVDFMCIELTKVVNDQLLCIYSMAVNGAKVNDRFQLGFPNDPENESAEYAESKLADYLQRMYETSAAG